jgi:hypothetical protein
VISHLWKLRKLQWRAEQPARIPDHGPKIGIFLSKPLHKPPYKTTRKQLKVSIAQFPQGFCLFFKKIPLAA